MKKTIPGGCRIYNHRHFPNVIHAQLVKLKGETKVNIEELIVKFLELGLSVGMNKTQIKNEAQPVEKVSPIKNDSTWEMMKTVEAYPTLNTDDHSQQINNLLSKIPNLEDRLMPRGIIPIQEEI